MKIDKEAAEASILGGAILGGGGGGWIEEGRTLAQLALQRGFSKIHSLKDIPDEAVLLTVSAVGAPSAGSSILEPEDYVRAVEMFAEKTGIKIGGLISSEIGALGIVNGWLQSAALNIPVVDAPCNGRAHPLGLMGSMGLTKKEKYISRQTAVGGRAKSNNQVEAFFEGPLSEVSKKVRESAVTAGEWSLWLEIQFLRLMLKIMGRRAPCEWLLRPEDCFSKKQTIKLALKKLLNILSLSSAGHSWRKESSEN